MRKAGAAARLSRSASTTTIYLYVPKPCSFAITGGSALADAAVAIDGTPIHVLVDGFKQALLAADSDKVVVQRRIIEPAPAMMDPDAYFALREEVALGLGVHLKDVFMVGSGKLGFSVKPGETPRV